jgi:hypothetical protein
MSKTPAADVKLLGMDPVADSVQIPQAAIRTVLEQLGVSVSEGLDSDAVQHMLERNGVGLRCGKTELATAQCLHVLPGLTDFQKKKIVEQFIRKLHPEDVPLAPEILADALQDRVAPSSGPLLNASPVFKECPSPEDYKELVALGAMLLLPESGHDLWECNYEGYTVRLFFVPRTSHPWKACVVFPGSPSPLEPDALLPGAYRGSTPKEAIERAVAPMQL